MFDIVTAKAVFWNRMNYVVEIDKRAFNDNRDQV